MYPICTTCGVQYEASEKEPEQCPICEDDRQYVGVGGQSWTSLEKMADRHKNIIEKIAPDLYALYTTPTFAIGQRAHLIRTPQGNILWDCITHLDESTVDLIGHLGGLKAIAVSHPHYFSTIVEWSRAFGNAPVYINRLDEKWLGRRDEAVHFWEGELPLWDGIRLIQCGGHFPGGSILHWPAGSDGKGALLSGDVIQVSPDRRSVSFMYSYPNLIPLPKKGILQIREAVADLPYDAVYGAFGHYIRQNARQAVAFSINRYLRIFD